MKTTTISLRIPEETKDQLEELAKLYRMNDGEPWSVSDVVRLAITEKLEKAEHDRTKDR